MARITYSEKSLPIHKSHEVSEIIEELTENRNVIFCFLCIKWHDCSFSLSIHMILAFLSPLLFLLFLSVLISRKKRLLQESIKRISI